MLIGVSHSLGNSLPESLRAVMSGSDLSEREGHTFQLLTTSRDGWPYQALLSVGEVLAVGPRTIRLALWPNSTATHNLTENGRATLTFILDGASYALRLLAARGSDLAMSHYGHLAFFEATVEEVREDRAPYANLVSGVTFELKDREEVLPRWEATVRASREHPPVAVDRAPVA